MAITKRPIMRIKGGCSCSMPGVWRAVAHNEGAVVIYHSPKACGHVTSDMDLADHYRLVSRQEFTPKKYKTPLITSELQEEHAIFGGNEQLRQCINYVAERYKPLYIVVASSCVAGIIGDDIQMVTNEVEQDIGIPIVAVPCSGFLDGEYHAGFYHTAKALMKLITPLPQIENTVTLIGDRDGENGVDIQEMEQLLSYFGLRVHCYFPGNASLREIKKVSASSMSVLLGGRPHSYAWMRKIAVDLQELFGVPFFDCDYPVGWRGTQIWLKKMGEFLGREEEALQIEKLQQERLQRATVTAQLCMKLKVRKIVLCIGRPLIHFQPEWVLEFLEQAGVVLEAIVLLKGMTDQEAMRQELMRYTTYPILNDLEGEGTIQAAHLVITTHELKDTSKRQLFLPMLPPVGVGGLMLMMYKLARLEERPGRRGGIIYG